MVVARIAAFARWLVLVILLLSLAVWWFWIPSAREPGYAFVAAWGAAGRQPGQFRDPTGIAVTASEVFVSDARNGRIQVFDHQGRFRRAFIVDAGGPSAAGRPKELSNGNGAPPPRP